MDFANYLLKQMIPGVAEGQQRLTLQGTVSVVRGIPVLNLNGISFEIHGNHIHTLATKIEPPPIAGGIGLGSGAKK